MVDRQRATARELAQQFLAQGNPLGWFDALYALARENPSLIPWAELRPNPHLIEWLDTQRMQGEGRKALKVGCGLGDDAEELARRGLATTAFDVSETAIAWCRQRFAHTVVEYAVADLFAAPSRWDAAFDLVVEIYTLQVLAAALRPAAIRAITRFVRPGGTLLVIARGREPADAEGNMPWPLTREELNAFTSCGLTEQASRDFMDDEDPPVRRFLAWYTR